MTRSDTYTTFSLRKEETNSKANEILRLGAKCKGLSVTPAIKTNILIHTLIKEKSMEEVQNNPTTQNLKIIANEHFNKIIENFKSQLQVDI